MVNRNIQHNKSRVIGCQNSLCITHSDYTNNAVENFSAIEKQNLHVVSNFVVIENRNLKKKNASLHIIKKAGY